MCFPSPQRSLRSVHQLDRVCDNLRREVIHVSFLSREFFDPKQFKHTLGQALLIGIFGMAAVRSSSAQKITIEFDKDADFSKYKTFAVRNGELNSKNPALNGELVKKQIDADIERDLTSRGLAPVSGKTDLNVRYRFGSARKAEVERYPAGWRGYGTRVVRVPYSQGTLVIDLRNPATGSLVWRAIATEDKSDATKIEGKLDDMVKKALEKFPPKQK